MSLLLISKLCQDLSFSNFGDIGTCFVQFVFFGDLGLTGLMLMAVFVGYIVRYNMPGSLILPLSVALTYVLYIVSQADFFLFCFILTLIATGVVTVMALLNFINR